MNSNALFLYESLVQKLKSETQDRLLKCTPALDVIPHAGLTSASTKGLPRLSRISLAIIFVICVLPLLAICVYLSVKVREDKKIYRKGRRESREKI